MEEVVTLVARHDERIEHLEMWQQKQNGSLQALEARVSDLQEKQEERFRSIEAWLRGIMGGLLVSLAMLVADLLMRGVTP